MEGKIHISITSLVIKKNVKNIIQLIKKNPNNPKRLSNLKEKKNIFMRKLTEIEKDEYAESSNSAHQTPTRQFKKKVFYVFEPTNSTSR